MNMSETSQSRIYNDEELNSMKCDKENSQRSNVKKSKHSLDSDEEDEEETAKKYNVLDPNELEGQEDKTIEFDGEIKITPFNMKEELEEGYFDKEGTYIFNKESDVIKDQWLDDIDWVKVKEREQIKSKHANSSDSDEDLPSLNVIEHYKKMLELMHPKETVQKAICRMGGSNASRSASNRWKKKKENGIAEENVDIENKEKLQAFIRLADDIIQSGDMDIYQQTYEMLSHRVSLSEKSFDTNSNNADAALDMFGEEFDEKVDDTKKSEEFPNTPSPSGQLNAENEVMWEFKWDCSDDSKIYGPFPTSQILQWVNDKYFDKGVFVRQCDKPDSQFYNSKRIDFDLYL